MINYKIVFQYSKALVQLSGSREQLENQLSELEELMRLLEEIPILKQFLYHPFVRAEEKKKILEKLLKNQSNDRILNFLFFLIDKKRMHYLTAIVEEYHRLAKLELGIVEASVTTAIPIEEKTIEEIRAKLEKQYGKKIQLESKVDPQILGGMVLMIADKILDNSTKNQLMKLKEHLTCD